MARSSGNVMMGNQRSKRKPSSVKLPAKYRDLVGLEDVLVRWDGKAGDGTIMPVPTNGALAGHLRLWQRIETRQGVKHVPKYTRLPDAEIGLVTHLALILAELAMISADNAEVAEVQQQLQQWLRLSESAIEAIQYQLTDVSGHYEAALHPAKEEAYWQIFKASSLKDSLGRNNPSAALARLVAAVRKLGQRFELLHTIELTNIERQEWIARMLEMQDRDLEKLFELLEGRDHLDGEETYWVNRLFERPDYPLRWPFVLPWQGLHRPRFRREVEDPELLETFRQGLAFEQNYNYLLEPVRPVAAWGVWRLETLKDVERTYLKLHLSERADWLTACGAEGIHPVLTAQSAQMYLDVASDLEGDVNMARKRAEQLKHILRYEPRR